MSYLYCNGLGLTGCVVLYCHCRITYGYPGYGYDGSAKGGGGNGCVAAAYTVVSATCENLYNGDLTYFYFNFALVNDEVGNYGNSTSGTFSAIFCGNRNCSLTGLKG